MTEVTGYQRANRIAKVIPRTYGGYRVWMYDIYTEQQKEELIDDKTIAENLAKEWCDYE